MAASSTLTIGQRLLNRESALSFLNSPVPTRPEPPTAVQRFMDYVKQFVADQRQAPDEAPSHSTTSAEHVLAWINRVSTPETSITLSNIDDAGLNSQPVAFVSDSQIRLARYSFALDDMQLFITVEYCPLVPLLLDADAQAIYMNHLYGYQISPEEILTTSSRRGRPKAPSAQSAQSPGPSRRSISPGRSPSRLSSGVTSPARRRPPGPNTPSSEQRAPESPAYEDNALIVMGLTDPSAKSIQTHNDQLDDAADARKTRALEFLIEATSVADNGPTGQTALPPSPNSLQLNIRLAELIYPTIYKHSKSIVGVDPFDPKHQRAFQQSSLCTKRAFDGIATNLAFMHSLGWKLAHRANADLPLALQDPKTYTPEVLSVNTHFWNKLVSSGYGIMQEGGPFGNGTVLWSVVMNLLLQPPQLFKIGWMMLITHKSPDVVMQPSSMLSIYDDGSQMYAPCVSVLDGDKVYRRPSLMYITTLTSNLGNVMVSNWSSVEDDRPRKLINGYRATVTLHLEAVIYNHAKDTAISVSKKFNANRTILNTPDYRFPVQNGSTRIGLQLCVDYLLQTKPDDEAVLVENVRLKWAPLQDSNDLAQTVVFSDSISTTSGNAVNAGKRSSRPTDNVMCHPR